MYTLYLTSSAWHNFLDVDSVPDFDLGLFRDDRHGGVDLALYVRHIHLKIITFAIFRLKNDSPPTRFCCAKKSALNFFFI